MMSETKMAMDFADSNVCMKRNLYDRVSQLLVSYEWSDCTFSVSGTKFKAHKLLLGISSPVFKAMFYGPMSSDKDVVINDMEPNIFQELITYIYTDKIELTNIEQAFELLYAAKKYMMEYLSEKCKAYIENNVGIDNVLLVLNYAEFVQEKALFDQALTVLCSHSEYLIQHHLDNVSLPAMKAMLESRQVNCMEHNLIKATFKWSHFYCTKNDIRPTIENRRKVLIDNDLLKNLRFLTLRLPQFNDIIESDNLLLPAEVECIKWYVEFGLKIEDKVFTDNISQERVPRAAIKFRWHFCHRSALRSASPLKIDHFHNEVQIRMKCDKTVFINSLGVKTRLAPQVNYMDEPLCMEYSENFLITIIKESDRSVIKSMPFNMNVEHDSTIFIDFGVPALIQKDVWYNLAFTWPCDSDLAPYRYVVCHRNRTCNHKATFVFEDMAVNSDISGSFLEALKYTF